MIPNSLVERKPLFKKPLFALSNSVMAIGLGLFLYGASNNNNAETTEPIATDRASSRIEGTLTSTAYDDELSKILTTSLLRVDSAVPLVAKNTVVAKPASKIKRHVAGTPLVLLPNYDRVITLRVASGDSLSAIFSKVGLSATVLHRVLESAPAARKHFTQLSIGQRLDFTVSEKGELRSLVSKPNMLETYTISKSKLDSSYRLKQETITPTYRETYAHGVIKSSLSATANRANIPHKMTLEIANAFGYDIDFALDLREGDEFEAIFEQKLVNGKVIGTGDLLAARFVNRGREYTAVRFKNKHGSVAFYRADGSGMRRAFIRTPVDFTRISSKFSMGRNHPVLNRIRAHKGVDYAAPTGTSIHASGDGRIIERGVKGGYGNAIVVQHGKTYTTLYAHMSRFAPDLKVGSFIKQGQTIGYVGMTGLATGPHLHYEFRENGQHVDPLSIKLPMADPLQKAEKTKFLALTKPLIARMEQERGTMVAAAKDSPVSNPESR